MQDHKTTLMLAAERGHTEVVKELLAVGVKMEAKDEVDEAFTSAAMAAAVVTTIDSANLDAHRTDFRNDDSNDTFRIRYASRGCNVVHCARQFRQHKGDGHGQHFSPESCPTKFQQKSH